MSKVYKYSPIIEAVCEITFKPSQEWDWTIPGLFYEHIKEKFPIKKEKKQFNVQLKTDNDEFAQEIKHSVNRMQFFAQDETRLLQVGPNKLSINKLKPYLNWEDYRSMIVDAFKIYNDVVVPENIDKIGLRYINRIETREMGVEIEDYLTAVPKVSDKISQIFKKWVQRVEIPFENLGALLILQSGSAQDDKLEGVAFILDLDFVSFKQNEIDLDSAVDWIDKAHDEVEHIFEACITNKSREIFDEVTLK